MLAFKVKLASNSRVPYKYDVACGGGDDTDDCYGDSLLVTIVLTVVVMLMAIVLVMILMVKVLMTIIMDTNMKMILS